MQLLLGTTRRHREGGGVGTGVEAFSYLDWMHNRVYYSGMMALLDAY